MAAKGGQKKAGVLTTKSPAEFFAENKNIAGFDNVRGRAGRGGGARAHPRRARARAPHPPRLPLSAPCLQPGKCLYTTIRELVENALDSAEAISMLPAIDITMCVPLRRCTRAAASRCTHGDMRMRRAYAHAACMHACSTGRLLHPSCTAHAPAEPPARTNAHMHAARR